MSDPDLDVGRFGHRDGLDSTVEACKAWYGALATAPPATAADVTASWMARFRPFARRLTRRPTAAEKRRFAGVYGSPQRRDERGRFAPSQWWAIAPTVVLGQAGADREAAAQRERRVRRRRPQTWTFEPDAGGAYLAVGEDRIRDGDTASQLIGSADPLEADVARLIRDLMPRSRGSSPTQPSRASRKRRDATATARALALAVLAPRLGARAAARALLRWDDELGTQDRNVRGGELASRAAEGLLADIEPDELDVAEAATLRSAKRIWQALGIEPLPGKRPRARALRP